MDFIHSKIGSAKDNFKSPVHDWYKFTAGFSHKFVDEIIKLERLDADPKAKIFDAFAGCGTTLVSAQKANIKAIGNEAQDFMYEVIKAKLNWSINENKVFDHLSLLKQLIAKKRNSYPISEVAHPLLKSLYTPYTLKVIYLIKDYISRIDNLKHKLFFKLALSQTLHKVALHPIAVPYISRNKSLLSKKTAWHVFKFTVLKMLNDNKLLRDHKRSSEIYLQDSRYPNKKIKANSCTICITSPPYLNNLDYGEMSKVHTHFFGVTNNWNDITETVRKKLVTGSTTHYLESEFSLLRFKRSIFYRKNKKIADNLIKRYKKLKRVSEGRLGKKSFHILMLLYFEDMYKVLLEIRRVLRPGAKAYIILGDSAPYGVFVQTTKIIGKIALNVGFEKYKIIKIRSRGSKWKGLTYRHKHELSENVLILS